MGLDALLENQHGHWPFNRVQKLHIHSVSVPGGSKLRHFSIFEKLSLFSLYGQQFLRYGPIFKAAAFGHETWPMVKVKEVANILSLYPREIEVELIFALRAAVSEIWAHFQNCHIWAWNLAIAQSARSYTYTLSLSKRESWAYFRFTGNSFWDTGRFSKLPYLGMKLGHWPKCQKLHIYCLPTPVGRSKLSLYSLYRQQFLRYDFQNCHIWAWNVAIGQSARNRTYTS